MDECISKAALPSRKRNRPWLFKKLIKAIHRRDMLYKLAKTYGYFSRYKWYTNKLVNQLRLAKKPFSRKSFLSTLRSCGKPVSLCTEHLVPTSLSYQVMVKLQKTSTKKTEHLNTFFSACFKELYPPFLVHLMTPYQPVCVMRSLCINSLHH